MLRLRHKLLIVGLRVFDQLILALALFTIISYAKGVTDLWHIEVVLNRTYRLLDFLGLAFIAVNSVVIFNHFLRYESNRYVTLIREIINLSKAITSIAFGLIIAAVIFDFETLTLNGVVVFWGVSMFVGVLSRIVIRQLLFSIRKSGRSQRHILVVGVNENSIGLAKRLLASPELGYKLVGFIEDNNPNNETSIIGAECPEEFKVVGGIEELGEILENKMIDEVVISLPLRQRVFDVDRAIRLCGEIGVVARIIPDLKHKTLINSLNVEEFEGDPVLTFFRENLIMQLLMKRLMDISVSIVMLILLSPLMLLISLSIKLTSKGPVFFAQNRVGMNKRSFKLLKFRSMVVDAEKLKKDLLDKNEVDGPVFKIKLDPRVTSIGRIIRKTSLDELPQLLNVLKGEMSLVGPRPPLMSEVKEYEWLFRKRLAIKPGITCLWQVMGRNTLTFERWMELDKQYVDNWSVWLDLKILLKTIPVVLTGHGAS